MALNFAGESYYYLTKIVINTFEEEKFSPVNDEDGTVSGITTNFKDLSTVEELWKVLLSLLK